VTDRPSAWETATIGRPIMPSRSAKYRRPTGTPVSGNTRRGAIAVAVVTPLLLLGMLDLARHPAPLPDAGLVGCIALTATNGTTAGYPAIGALFARSRWTDLRTAGTEYADLITQLRTARGTDGYQAVWFYERLATACTRHGWPLTART
jgi:hypothetical protein